MRRHSKWAWAAIAALSAVWSTAAQAEPSVERGEYLVDGLAACGNCHTPRNPDGSFNMDLYMAGGFEFLEPPAFEAYSRNITPDVETGIGTWTAEEIVNAIREGHTPEDEKIGPPMPIFMYNLISDDDAMSMAMYLQSIPAVHNEVPESTYNIEKPVPGPAPGAAAPSPDDEVAYGEYLATVAHCLDCHTPRNEMGEPDFARAGAGGFGIVELPDGRRLLTANITSDEETGIGDWSDEALRRALTEGISANGHILFPIMPSSFFKNATEEDLDAIIAFIRTLPPVSNEVEKIDWMAAMGMPPMEMAPAIE